MLTNMIKTSKEVFKLPKEVQAKIDLAMDKVKVLKDSEIEIARSVKKLKEENARLSIETETLSEENKKSKIEYKKSADRLKSSKKDMEGIDETLAELRGEVLEAKKVLMGVKKKEDLSRAKLGELMAKKLEVEDEVKEKLKSVEKEVSEWEFKKKQVVDTLNILLK